MEERELVKIASNNPAHPKGYYTGFKDQMKPGDVVFGAAKEEIKKEEKGESTKDEIEISPEPKIKKTKKRK